MPTSRNYKNVRFGNLIALRKGLSHFTPSGALITTWICRCDCGYEKQIITNALQRKLTRSCGRWECDYAKSLRKRYYRHGSPIQRHALAMYKSAAKSKNIAFTLSKDYFFELVSSNCYYCGAFPSNSSKRIKGAVYNGVDRIDSRQGYINGNVRSCCGKCNTMKNDLTESEFFEQIKKIYLRFSEKQT